MIPQHRPLIEVFTDIPDFRRPRGKRHPLSGILALSCCAMLCGSRSYGAIAEWGRNYGPHIARALGFRHHTPCASTLFTIFGHLDREACEAKLGGWADSVVANTPAVPETPGDAMAVDGKTLRGSKSLFEKYQAASRLSIKRVIATYTNVSLVVGNSSSSLLKRRHWFNQANVLSTTHRCGNTAKPFWPSARATDSRTIWYCSLTHAVHSAPR